MSQALRAGVPQLIQPMAFDQFDNASHVVQLGAGREIPARHFQPVRVAAELSALLADAALAANCRRHQAALDGEDGTERACALLLESLASKLK